MHVKANFKLVALNILNHTPPPHTHTRTHTHTHTHTAPPPPPTTTTTTTKNAILSRIMSN